MLFTYSSDQWCVLWHLYWFHNVEHCVPPLGVEEGLPWCGRPHGNPDGRLRLHHGVRAERAISRMLAEHVQAAQLLLPHLRSHRHPGEKLPRELPFRWEPLSSTFLLFSFLPTSMHAFSFTSHLSFHIFFHTLFAQNPAFFSHSYFLSCILTAHRPCSYILLPIVLHSFMSFFFNYVNTAHMY